MFIGSHYYDRNELLKFVGSKQVQSGIIWGPKEPNCIIITSGGRGGKSAGYSDEKGPEDTIFYIGQGEKGDQNPKKFSNSLLINGQRSILFFITKEPNAEEVRERGNYKKFYQFVGFYQLAAWEFIVPTSGKRASDKLLRFTLIPAKNIYDNQLSLVEESQILYAKRDKDLIALKKKIKDKTSKPQKGRLNIASYFLRCQEIIKYALLRAGGYCENCNKPAPFVTAGDVPFLEVHHILRLADDGPDEPENVAAICPNCHKEAHYGKNKDGIKNYLMKIISEKENIIVYE